MSRDWDEREHPRHADGRFRDGAGGLNSFVQRLSDEIGSRMRTNTTPDLGSRGAHPDPAREKFNQDLLNEAVPLSAMDEEDSVLESMIESLDNAISHSRHADADSAAGQLYDYMVQWEVATSDELPSPPGPLPRPDRSEVTAVVNRGPINLDTDTTNDQAALLERAYSFQQDNDEWLENPEFDDLIEKLDQAIIDNNGVGAARLAEKLKALMEREGYEDGPSSDGSDGRIDSGMGSGYPDW